MDSKEILSFLWGHLKKQRLWLFLSVLFAIPYAGLSVLMVHTLKPLMDLGFIAGDFKKTINISVLVVGLIFLHGLATYFHRLCLRIGIEKAIIDIKDQIFRKVLILSQKQLSKLESGKFVTLLFNDTKVITDGLHIASDTIRQPLTLIGLLGYLFYTNWILTLICIVNVPLVIFVTKKLGKSAKKNQFRIQSAADQASQHSLESIQGLRTVHAFGRLVALKDEFSEKLQQAYKPTIKQASVQEAVGPVIKLLFVISGAVLIVSCGYFVTVSKTMTPGQVLAYMMSAALIQDPVRQLSHVHVRLQEVYAATTRILGVINAEPDLVTKAQSTLLIRDIANFGCQRDPLPLKFSDVSFSYSPNERKLAVQQISFSVEPTKKVALVGPSGSGKSTLSLMAMRYLDPDTGGVLLGAKNAKDWSLEEYRSNFSYVSQDVFLFSKTLRDNLRFASPKATDTEIWNALELAQLKSFAESLPAKLDTIVQERALNLSGGEKQRIAIARAILRNAPIVILDEATSQLDIENEKLIQEAMISLVKGKSVLTIAHRLSTVKDSDEILVLDKGQILEKGSPQNLIGNENTWFHRMWFSQGYNS